MSAEPRKWRLENSEDLVWEEKDPEIDGWNVYRAGSVVNDVGLLTELEAALFRIGYVRGWDAAQK